MKNLFFVSLILFMFSCTKSNVKVEIAQWRGDNRDGKYNETGLLKSWPQNGPTMLWCNDNIGNGYGSAVVTKDAVYVMGEIDSIGYLFALDLKGNLLWKSAYGKEWMKDFIGSRSTPTVVNDLIYVCSSFGEIVCFDKEKGTKKWSKNLMSDFNGKTIQFGHSESLLIDDSTLFATPGGKDTNIIALNRFNGDVKWIGKGKNHKSAYCSPLLIELASRKVIVTFSATEIMGIDAKDGKLLWWQLQDTFCYIHANTVIYENGSIYYAAGCGNGLVKLELNADGSKIKEVWRSKKLINYISAVIKINNKIFGADENSNNWVCIDTGSGTLLDSLDFKKGVCIYADSMLYCYNEKGQMGLLNPYANKMELVSTFKISKGTKEHFSHPVIKNGLLFIRHGKSLIVYDIRKAKAA